MCDGSGTVVIAGSDGPWVSACLGCKACRKGK